MNRIARAQSGMTLLELMIVVAIIGVLAGIAIVTFSKSTNKAQFDSEINGMFTKLQLAQEQYNAENAVYLSTGADETDMFPTTPAGNDTPNDATALPATWTTLGIAPDSPTLFCSYVAVAGLASDGSNIGAVGTAFGFTAPDANWYYIVAECDENGRGGTNALYFASSATEGVFTQNEGL